MLKKVIIGSLIRRVIGYLGVAGIVGLESEVGQLIGMAGATLTLAWSIWEKVKAARAN